MPLAKGEPPLPAGINMSCVLEYNTIAKEVAAEVGGVIIDDLYVIRHHRHHHFSHRFSRGSQLYIATHTHTHTHVRHTVVTVLSDHACRLLAGYLIAARAIRSYDQIRGPGTNTSRTSARCGRQLRHHFGPFLTQFSALYHPHARRMIYALHLVCACLSDAD